MQRAGAQERNLLEKYELSIPKLFPSMRGGEHLDFFYDFHGSVGKIRCFLSQDAGVNRIQPKLYEKSNSDGSPVYVS